VSTVDTSTPGTLRRSRPIVTPAARTRKAGQQLCAAGSRATTSSRRTAPRRSWHGRAQSISCSGLRTTATSPLQGPSPPSA
jgi:hypothetical protein